jgi:uncharacterized protein
LPRSRITDLIVLEPNLFLNTRWIPLYAVNSSAVFAINLAMEPLKVKSRWVLVTGASSGLGREMARDLARKHGANLILVARRQERLLELKSELEKEANVQVVTIAADLTNEPDVDRVFQQATEGREVYGVILNAGVTYFGPHLSLPWSEFQQIMATNVTSTVRLTNLFLPYLIEKGQSGGLMLVTSLTGLFPAPYQTAYSATKGFLINFGRGLYHELKGRPVSVTTFVPGGINTEMNEKNGIDKYFTAKNPQIQSAQACANEGVNAFIQRRYMAIPGFLNRAQTFLSPLASRRFIGERLAAVYRKALIAAGKSP